MAPTKKGGLFILDKSKAAGSHPGTQLTTKGSPPFYLVARGYRATTYFEHC